MRFLHTLEDTQSPEVRQRDLELLDGLGARDVVLRRTGRAWCELAGLKQQCSPWSLVPFFLMRAIMGELRTVCPVAAPKLRRLYSARKKFEIRSPAED